MAETRLMLEPEVQKIFELIDKGKNFLLSGGAGSGKTYSLVQLIGQVIAENPTSQIACMTYTNAAVREIDSRFNNQNLSVSTIHDFLWDNIKSFSNELKKSLVELINSDEIKSPDGKVNNVYFADKEIQYKEYTIIREGIISHDELLVLANYMFRSYPKLCDILKDKFKFILVDEYQDTSVSVVQIVLEHLKQSKRKSTIGFFGDAMQSIYDDGVGNLNKYITSGDVQEIKKEQNRRNPQLVYELANKLRTDDIVQAASADSMAPNMQNGTVKEGSIKFYYSMGEEKLDDLKQVLPWDFANTKETKELNLTHNLIAPKAGFKNLMAIYDADKILEYRNRIKKYIKENNVTEDFSTFTFGQVVERLLEGKTAAERTSILPTPMMKTFIDANQELYKQAISYPFVSFSKIYVDKDALLDDKKADEDDESKSHSKRDSLIKHLFKIQTNVNLYTDGKYNDFLRKTEFKINSVADKRQLKEIVVHLQGMSNNTIEEVIEYAHDKKICRKDDKLTEFIEKKKYVYDQVKQLQFGEFQKLFYYLEGYTPFSTQHKIKGAQFDNVLVVLDNGNWSKYNFNYLMDQDVFNTLTPAQKKTHPTILDRTQKLFYVCCTRTKENLVVYFCNPSPAALEKANNWFGVDNVHGIKES
ncbi:MAG: UvrD-helicase domain-containing protein [Gallionellaceae bacterium]